MTPSTFARPLLAFALVAALGAPARAQAPAADGAALLRLMPARLAGHPRQDPNAYSRFATAAYRLEGQTIATLQIHEVRGAGAAAHQRNTCTRRQTIGGHEACVATRRGTTHLVWVFSDTVQVMVGAPEEATAVAMAADLDLDAIAALAASLR